MNLKKHVVLFAGIFFCTYLMAQRSSEISAEPKFAKQAAKEYAERNPGIYRLCKIEDVAYYFTEKED